MINRRDPLSERKRLILRAVIDAYISGGEPVGSKFLTQTEQISYSSATIRNEMAELEAMGYLEQPHTSAGRVPSERGYRFYVDSLMESYRLTEREMRELQNLMQSRIERMETIMDRAGKLMAMLTNYTTLLATPNCRATVILQYQVMWLSSDTLLLVMVAETSGTHTARTAYLNVSAVTPEMAKTLEMALNMNLTHISAEQITLPKMMQLRQALHEMGCEALVNQCVTEIYRVLSETEGGDLKVEGINRLLQYPEYSNPESLSTLLESFDHKSDILDVVARSDTDAVNVYIGSENELNSLRDSTMIFKKIKRGGRVIGAIGVIGPCRMKYNKVISMLDTFSKRISEMEDDNG